MERTTEEYLAEFERIRNTKVLISLQDIATYVVLMQATAMWPQDISKVEEYLMENLGVTILEYHSYLSSIQAITGEKYFVEEIKH